MLLTISDFCHSATHLKVVESKNRMSTLYSAGKDLLLSIFRLLAVHSNVRDQEKQRTHWGRPQVPRRRLLRGFSQVVTL